MTAPAAGSGPDATGLVTDTIEFSSVDGPGNRFVVFLQGCSFDCVACHNPYTIQPCIDCGACVPVCPSGALTFDLGVMRWDERLCAGGDACLDACPHDSTPKARTRTVADLLGRIRLAAPFLSGVTVSGGEATQQPGFVAELFSAIRTDPTTAGLTCFIDTNGDTTREVWARLAPLTDGVMVDLKCLDPEIHQRMTGQPNDRVLASISHLAPLGRLHEVRLLMLPGVNDADALLAATGRWLAEVDPHMRVKVIGFRQHGVRPSTLPLVEPTADQRQHYADVLAAYGDFDLTVV